MADENKTKRFRLNVCRGGAVINDQLGMYAPGVVGLGFFVCIQKNGKYVQISHSFFF